MKYRTTCTRQTRFFFVGCSRFINFLFHFTFAIVHKTCETRKEEKKGSQKTRRLMTHFSLLQILFFCFPLCWAIQCGQKTLFFVKWKCLMLYRIWKTTKPNTNHLLSSFFSASVWFFVVSQFVYAKNHFVALQVTNTSGSPLFGGFKRKIH